MTSASHASGEGPLDLVRALIVVEGEAAAIAARRMRDADIRELERILETMVSDPYSEGSYLRADRAFHLYIAEKTGNRVLVRIVAELFDARHSLLSLPFRKHFEEATTWRQAIAEHKAIIKALASRNPQAAKQAMQRHLRCAHNRLTKQIEGENSRDDTSESEQAPETPETG